MTFRGRGNGKKLLLAFGLGITLAGFMPTGVNAAPGRATGSNEVSNDLLLEEIDSIDSLEANIVDYDVDDGCKWTLDSNGKLTVRSVSSSSNLDNTGWYKYKDKIKEVDIDVPYSSHLSFMFYGFKNLEKAKVKIDKGVGDADYMFNVTANESSATGKLKELNIYQLNTSGVTDMSYMFSGCNQLTSLDLSGLDTSKVENMEFMFGGCSKLTTLNIGSFDTSNVVSFQAMFNGCTSLRNLDITGFNMYNARNLSAMFCNCVKLESVSMKGWDVRNVSDFSYMFCMCESLKTVDLSGWNTKRAKKMQEMFSSCSNLKTLNLSGLDVSNVEDMEEMFCNCKKLKTLNLNGFNTAKVEDMSAMFYDCAALEELNLRSFSAASLKNVSYMFRGCSSLRSLDLSSFYMTDAFNNSDYSDPGYGMFDSCYKLKVIKPPKNLKKKVYIDRYSGGTWYRDDTKKAIEYLPMKVTKTISLHFQESGNPLYDVRETDWQYEPATYVYRANIMKGTDSTKDNLVIFEPNKAMTRAEFVQTLYNYMAIKDAKYDKKRFTDVPNGKWYTKAIMWASEEGLVAGIGNKKFGVDNKVTRQDMVTILYKLAKKQGDKYITVDKKFTLSSYTDQKTVKAYAKIAMTWAAGNKIISGKPVGKKYKLDPEGNATRAECAAIIKNYVEFKKTK